ncbi:unnamed protein product [Amoebophrya sp. A25]|nr:unnamed protein product [Amoebophrya sp. A25]|eukprot:GSA25T00009401001.1
MGRLLVSFVVWQQLILPKTLFVLASNTHDKEAQPVDFPAQVQVEDGEVPQPSCIVDENANALLDENAEGPEVTTEGLCPALVRKLTRDDNDWERDAQPFPESNFWNDEQQWMLPSAQWERPLQVETSPGKDHLSRYSPSWGSLRSFGAAEHQHHPEQTSTNNGPEPQGDDAAARENSFLYRRRNSGALSLHLDVVTGRSEGGSRSDLHADAEEESRIIHRGTSFGTGGSSFGGDSFALPHFDTLNQDTQYSGSAHEDVARPVGVEQEGEGGDYQAGEEEHRRGQEGGAPFEGGYGPAHDEQRVEPRQVVIERAAQRYLTELKRMLSEWLKVKSFEQDRQIEGARVAAIYELEKEAKEILGKKLWQQVCMLERNRMKQNQDWIAMHGVADGGAAGKQKSQVATSAQSDYAAAAEDSGSTGYTQGFDLMGLLSGPNGLWPVDSIRAGLVDKLWTHLKNPSGDEHPPPRLNFAKMSVASVLGEILRRKLFVLGTCGSASTEQDAIQALGLHHHQSETHGKAPVWQGEEASVAQPQQDQVEVSTTVLATPPPQSRPQRDALDALEELRDRYCSQVFDDSSAALPEGLEDCAGAAAFDGNKQGSYAPCSKAVAEIPVKMPIEEDIEKSAAPPTLRRSLAFIEEPSVPGEHASPLKSNCIGPALKKCRATSVPTAVKSQPATKPSMAKAPSAPEPMASVEEPSRAATKPMPGGNPVDRPSRAATKDEPRGPATSPHSMKDEPSTTTSPHPSFKDEMAAPSSLQSNKPLTTSPEQELAPTSPVSSSQDASIPRSGMGAVNHEAVGTRNRRATGSWSVRSTGGAVPISRLAAQPPQQILNSSRQPLAPATPAGLDFLFPRALQGPPQRRSTDTRGGRIEVVDLTEDDF